MNFIYTLNVLIYCMICIILIGIYIKYDTIEYMYKNVLKKMKINLLLSRIIKEIYRDCFVFTFLLWHSLSLYISLSLSTAY